VSGAYASPLLALLITVLIGTLMFVALGKDPVKGCRCSSGCPSTAAMRLGRTAGQGHAVLIIALGLAVCFRSNVWNIGAEGQYILGAIFAGRGGA
jgi:ABC-type uncharacterized transport system permease subunit